MPDGLDQVSVAILTGGKSSRMCEDKALLPWEGGPLIDRVISVAKSIPRGAETIIVGDRPEYRQRGARVVADDFPSSGPLGGIATALRAAKEKRTLVLAVDMPFLSLPLLRAMTELQFAGDALVPHIAGWQPLHAVYDYSCLAKVRQQIDRDELKISDLFAHIEVVRLEPRWIGTFDPQFRSFENINTPLDYRRAVRAACKREVVDDQ